MLLNRDLALIIFQKVRNIQVDYKAYVLDGKNSHLSVEDLQKVIERMYDLKIFKTQVAFQGEYIRGLMERYNGKIRVRVKQEQPEDWKRFTAVKEMCHGIIDEEEDWSPDGTGRIKDLLIEYSIQNGDEAQRATQSEAFAEIAAIELMYPFEFRASDLKKVAGGKETFVKIAIHHGLPDSMVERALSNQYNEEIANPIWDKINGN